MAMFQTKVGTVTGILSEHLSNNIQVELKRKLMRHVEEEIDEIVKQVTYDLVDKIDAHMEIDGDIKVNILLKDTLK